MRKILILGMLLAVSTALASEARVAVMPGPTFGVVSVLLPEPGVITVKIGADVSESNENQIHIVSLVGLDQGTEYSAAVLDNAGTTITTERFTTTRGADYFRNEFPAADENASAEERADLTALLYKSMRAKYSELLIQVRQELLVYVTQKRAELRYCEEMLRVIPKD